MSSDVLLLCSNEACRERFEKPRKEYDRRKRLGQVDFYCSSSCAAVVSNRKSPRKGDIGNFKGSLGRRADPFRWFMLRARQRKHKGATDLTTAYLKELWESQRGCCPFTGWGLILPNTTNGWKAGRNPRNASLDRIDNSKGYVQGNVRFIAVIANMARGLFSDEDVKLFCKAVASWA